MRVTRKLKSSVLDDFISNFYFSFMQVKFSPVRFISRVGAPLRRVR